MTDKTPSYTNLNPGRLLVVYKGLNTELLDWRWLSGLVEYNQPIHLPRLHIYLQLNNITQIQVNLDPYTKTKSFFTPIHKTSQFRSLHWNQVKFDPPHWIQRESMSSAACRRTNGCDFNIMEQGCRLILSWVYHQGLGCRHILWWVNIQGKACTCYLFSIP